MTMTAHALPARVAPDWPSTDVMQAVAVEVGACIRPIMQRLIDTTTGEATIVPIPCGATWAGHCPPCAERHRKLRITQCREGWHLGDDPIPTPDEVDQADETDPPAPLEDDDQGAELDEDESARRHRSTRRRQDAPDLPSLPVEARSIGREFTGRDGHTYRPSMFVTVTMPSYGRVLPDGTPRNPKSYDYRRQVLDSMHFGKLFDRLIQNLRRAAGYRVQYFAAVEPQRRLVPHVHMAIRGAIPRTLIKQVIAATYAQVWWPSFDEPIYDDPSSLPVWVPGEDGTGRYADPYTGELLPTWDEALQALDDDRYAVPAHIIWPGKQTDIQGLIAGSKADKTIGYLTKYLTKSIAEGAADPGDDDLTPRQRAHVARLEHEAQYLPCSPECANWLRYGVTPKNATARMAPGHCGKRAHWPERLGYGGRRVLVSRHWTGKTLTEHAADRRSVVRAVLEEAGVELPEGHSATELREDGFARWVYEALDVNELDAGLYRRTLVDSITRRVAWREQYERARDGTGPPGVTGHSATTPETDKGGTADGQNGDQAA